MTTGIGELSGAGLLCAVLTGLAVWWVLPDPAGPLRRVAPTREGPRRGSRLYRLWDGRDGAPPPLRRLVLAGVSVSALLFAVSGWSGGPGPVLWLSGPPLALGAAIGLGWLEPLSTRRRQLELVRQVPQALELLSACLAAGMPVRMGCAAVVEVFDGPVAEDLGQVLAATGLGVSDADAWRSLRGHALLGPPALDLARSVESGTMLVESLQHHAEVARERRRAAMQVVARAVGVRSVMPLMLCFIPSFMLLGVVPTVVSAISQAFR